MKSERSRLTAFVVLIALLYYLYFQAPFLGSFPWSVPVGSGVYADYIDFSEWVAAAVIVMLGCLLFHIHYPMQWRSLWWGILIGLPSLTLMLFSDYGVIPMAFSIPDFKPLILVAIFNALEAGITEELIFRGTFLPLLRRAFAHDKHPVFWAVFLSSLIFGATHLNFTNAGNLFFDSLNQAVSAFGAGVLYAVLTICMKSLLPSIIIHTANDFLPLVRRTLYPTTWLYAESFHPFDPVSFAFLASDAVFQILLACLIYWVWRRRTVVHTNGSLQIK